MISVTGGRAAHSIPFRVRNLLTRRNVLIALILGVLAVNIVWRQTATALEETAPGEQTFSLTPREEEIAPSLSSLSLMGREWQQHLAALPPEARARSAARLQEETKFFASLVTLAPEERDRQMRERLEMLMNDPEAQAVVAGLRIKKLVKASPSARQKLMRSYVSYKSQVKPQ